MRNITTALIVLCCFCKQLNAECATSVWLGQQINSGPPSEPSSFVITDSNKLKKVLKNLDDELDTSIKVVKGSSLRIPETKNKYVTLVNGTVSSVSSQEDLGIRSDAYYLVCIAKQLRDYKRYASLNAVIMHGRYKNAVVHFRDDRFPEFLLEPYVAVYRIPDEMHPEPATLLFEFVHMYRK